jgi:outer membrane receptor for ferrienterochelin and colicins
VSAWRTDTRNLINVTVDKPPNPDSPSVFNYENVAQAYTQGVELSGRVRLVKATWLELGGMLLDAKDVTRNRPLEGRSPVKLTAQLTSKLRPWHLEGFFRASWSAPRPFYLGNGLGFANVLGFGEDKTVYAPATVDLELQVGWAVREWIKVFVNGRNLLDSGDQNFNPRPPRAVLGGVQLDL